MSVKDEIYFKYVNNLVTGSIKLLGALKKTFHAQDIILVGDRGMVKGPWRREWESAPPEEKVDFITALRRADIRKLVKASTHPIQLSLFDERSLTTVEEGGRRYILCRNPYTREEERATREALLAKTEEKLAALERLVVAGRLKRKEKILARVLRWINRWKVEPYFCYTVEEGSFTFCRDQERITEESRLDGCYVIVTSLSASEMDPVEVRDRYRSLAQVEQDFRTMKTCDVEIRPVRHWNEERVRGHVFLCSLALRVIHEAHRRLKTLLDRDEFNHSCPGGSLREIWDRLHEFSLAVFSLAGHEFHQVGEFSENQLAICLLLGVETDRKKLSRMLGL